MPLGVEHQILQQTKSAEKALNITLMPLGVEHYGMSGYGQQIPKLNITLMPLGVEHKILIVPLKNKRSEYNFDAVRR